jgi:hypothetical protein
MRTLARAIADRFDILAAQAAEGEKMTKTTEDAGTGRG